MRPSHRLSCARGPSPRCAPGWTTSRQDLRARARVLTVLVSRCRSASGGWLAGAACVGANGTVYGLWQEELNRSQGGGGVPVWAASKPHFDGRQVGGPCFHLLLRGLTNAPGRRLSNAEKHPGGLLRGLPLGLLGLALAGPSCRTWPWTWRPCGPAPACLPPAASVDARRLAASLASALASTRTSVLISFATRSVPKDTAVACTVTVGGW
jgi:hypothetical protein